ncbi:alpha-1,3-mannosyl-glycoprotein 2-beta-N-acetylglucosaminyltransferase-like isoform X1 [Liolophura sinensis]|uniref:alpha-1,3-mannosyl-glycoprotein 2-beta-N-acetylglucosaminyltransferase-like isoform X1 n=1 Tax=Liolophura sinensis TaxID=3198878 RepID=UPI003158E728
MRLRKKRYMVVVVVMVFLSWNVLTYYVLVSKPSQAGQGLSNENVETQLDQLQADIQLQLQQNQRVLEDLRNLKRQAVADLKQLSPHGAVNPANNAPDKETPKPVVVVQVLPPVNDVENEPGNEKAGDLAQEDLAGQGGFYKSVARAGDPNKVILPILMIACDRVTVSKSLDLLLRLRPSADRFPIIVSQDCGHTQTAKVIQAYGSQVKHIQQPDLSDIVLPPKEKKFKGYFKISRHYKWALNQIFHTFNYSAVIVVEDDLYVSPDFFEYFAATYPYLHEDPLLWCVSAWNDNGKTEMVEDKPELLYRTDFFPGLGWMMERKTWLELEPKWPVTFWDDWMRHPEQRKDRECIRPELSRTSTFGKIGVSKGQFFEKHLKFIKLNDKFVPFTKLDLSYLKKENYDNLFVKAVYSSQLLTVSEVQSGARPELTSVRVQYNTKEQFKKYAKQLGIMEDLKAGVPRAGYRGVVSFMRSNRRVFLAPPPTWNGYDPKWN